MKRPVRSQFALLNTCRFLPLLIAQVAGALHDNIFKNALIASLIWGATASSLGDSAPLMVTVVAGVFLVPFCLLSGLGGQLADKFPREKVIRAVKVAEVGTAVLGAVALATGAVWLALVALFLLAAGSALFSPAKFAILPQHLRARELVGGNALLSTGTFLAILVGTILGTTMVGAPAGMAGVALFMVLFSLAGYVASKRIQPAPAPCPGLKLDANPLASTWATLRGLLDAPREVRLAVAGAGWFWFAAGVLVTQLPAYVSLTLSAGAGVLALFLSVFSVGVALGGLANHRLLRGRVEATYVPAAAMGIALFVADLSLAGAPGGPDGAGVAAFLASEGAWRIVGDLFAVSVCGGLFLVPLNAIIQDRAPERGRARILAGSSIVSALSGAAATAACALLLLAGASIPAIFGALALAGFAVAVVACRLLPGYLLKTLLQAVFKALYRVEVRGVEHLATAGPRAVVVANHVSFLDAPLLAAFLPGRPMFGVNTEIARLWWVRPWARLVRFFSLDPGSPFSLKALIKEVAKGQRCVIFPEGRLTETGALMKIYEGPGMVADKADAPIVPVRLDGVQYTPFATRLAGKGPRSFFPKITLTILPPRPMGLDPALRGRARRAAAGLVLYDLMEQMMYATWPMADTLFDALLGARRVHGGKAAIAEDVARKPASYTKLVRGSVALARALRPHISPPSKRGGQGGGAAESASKNPPLQGGKGRAVGLLLPNSVSALSAFFALQATGRVAAMLNFSAGAEAILSACAAAQVRAVVTSRTFIERARLGDLAATLEGAGLRLVYLEDVARGIGPLKKLRALVGAWGPLARRAHRRANVRPGDPAVILFTSGSEGAPKGVVLTHKNLLSNIAQLSVRVDFGRSDVVFNALPMFHAFGLTGGVLLPVLSGVRTFLYPSPLHYRIVPEMVYAASATIMFGTDTFLAGYARKANPYDFYRMRYIFAGAERVRAETRRLYMERFGVRVLEGYGATECAPVIAVNAPMHCRPGTVGRLLAGMGSRVEPVQGVAEGGRLFVRGDNVMAGYYRAGAPGVLEAPEGGWHDTGDIVSVDGQGYITITGRAKCFAKVAGEMVSLATAEGLAQAVSPDHGHAVVAADDAKKGQKLILVTTDKGLKRKALTQAAAERGAAALAVPAQIVVAGAIPLLPSGKTDYKAVEGLI